VDEALSFLKVSGAQRNRLYKWLPVIGGTRQNQLTKFPSL